MTTPRIDYARIGRAVTYYRTRGYTYLEVPWIVEHESTKVTLPVAAKAMATYCGPAYEGDLVGSAEQSFIQLLRRDQLAPGKYVAVSPCFRHEAVYNDRYQPYFMKVELIAVLPPGQDIARGAKEVLVYDMLATDAFEFFSSELTEEQESFLQYEPQDALATDIELAGIEVGSYGYREWLDHRWIYGTGLAEPRFSVARKATMIATANAV